jgi:dihydroxy-acid dehydratase
MVQRGPEAVRHPDPGRVPERHRRQLGDRRLDQRPDPPERPGPPHRCRLTIDDWQTVGDAVPLLVNLQPAGEYLGEDYYRAGGVPAVFNQLMEQGLIREGALTVSARPSANNYRDARSRTRRHPAVRQGPLVERAGFVVMRGNLFNSAIMKTSVISPSSATAICPTRTTRTPSRATPSCSTARGLPPPDRRSGGGITNAAILFMRGAGPIGYPGAAEVVNMRPPTI